MRRLLILAWCLLLLASAMAGPAAATFPGRNGKVLFSRIQPQGIYVMNADGTGVTRLTRGLDFGASWSPDGRWITFQRSAYPKPERIMVMRADGSDVHRVSGRTREGCFLQPPTWSPDGRHLAYVDYCFDAEPAVAQIRVAAADGSGEVRLTGYDALHALSRQPWSPDSQQIAFISDRDGDNDVYVMNIDGSGVTQLTSEDGTDEFEAVWSPTGGAIAFSAQDYPTADSARSSIWRVSEDGSSPTLIAQGHTHATEPLWAPNGRSLAFTSRTWMGAPTLVVVSADGYQQTPVIVGAETVNVAWSPNSRKLLVSKGGDLFRYTPDPGYIWFKRLTSTRADELGPDWGVRQ